MLTFKRWVTGICIFKKCPRWFLCTPKIKICWPRFLFHSSLPSLSFFSLRICLHPAHKGSEHHSPNCCLWRIRTEMDHWTKMSPLTTLSAELSFRPRGYHPLLGTEKQQKASAFTWLNTNFPATKFKWKYVDRCKDEDIFIENKLM